MASLANISIRSFVGAQGGFGQSSYNAAKAAGLTDDQIKNQLSASGLTTGSWVNNQLGLKPSSVAPVSTSQAATGSVSQSGSPNVNSFRNGGAFNMASYNAAISAGLTDDQIRNQLLGSGLKLGTGVQNKLGLPSSPVPIQQLPPPQAPAQQGQSSAAASGSGSQSSGGAAAAPAAAPASGTRFAGDAFNGSVAASYLQNGISTLNEVANSNKDNATIGGLVLGKMADIGATQANTGMAIAYNDAMYSSLGRQQQNLENTKAANAMQLMSAEGSIAKLLQKGNNATLRYNTDATANATKYGADKQVDAQRLVSDANKYSSDKQVDAQRLISDASKYSSDKQVDAQRLISDANRYGADQQLAGTRATADANRYGADRQVDAQRLVSDASRYGADQQLAGIREQTSSAERQIGLEGEQRRRDMNEQTMQQLALRRDARGAIASAGRRFYG